MLNSYYYLRMDTKELIKIHDLIDLTINLLDARDPYTFVHSFRVAELSIKIAATMEIDPVVVERIHVASHLHDIGKIGVPDKVLNKKGGFDESEMEQMRCHPRIGFNILSRLPVFSDIAPIVLYHHERYDGRGYPYGLKGEDIPIASRIIAVADTFDAITSDRSYRKSRSYETAIKIIGENSGSQFCPLVVEHFMNISGELSEILSDNHLEKVEHFAFTGHKELMSLREMV